MASVYLEVEVEEFFWNCSKSEREYLVSLLKEEGCIKLNDISGQSKENNPDQEWHLAVEKLKPNRYRLSSEEEEVIMRISSKFM